MALKVSGGGAGETPMATGRTVLVRDRYEIDSGKPLPDFDSPPALAYACVSKRDTKRDLVALICDPKVPPRLDIVGVMRRIDHRNIMRAVDWEIVDWPPEGRRCPAIILERPMGKKVMSSLDVEIPPMQEERVSRYFIEPVTQVLREMHGMGTYHRMIRPDNLYWMRDEGGEMVIGECFTSPPGITNPLVYETLECTLSSVAGRGEGSSENDMYAVGVTILALLTGKTPLQGRPDEEIQRLKLAQGSYAALVQNNRISLTMMEPLRGLLNDDPAERWTIEELMLWLNGRRLSPKQQVMPTKGSRALTVGGRDYTTAREIAYAMHRNWDQAVALIQTGALDTWLRRSLGEDDRVEAVNLAKAGGDNTDKLVARVLIALDPEGPIRLRAFSSTLDGMAPLIGAFADDVEARKLFGSVIGMSLFSFWMEQQRRLDTEHVRHMTRLEKIKALMNQTGFGMGMERVVYELNASLPCLSPRFERDYVPFIDHVLPALNRIAASPEPPTILVDRHMAAFVSTHFKRAIGPELRDIDRAPDEREGRQAQVQMLSTLQENLHRNVPFPELCEHLATTLDPVVERFHSRDRRERVVARIKKAAKSGRIQDILDVVEDNQEITEDTNEFNGATREHARATGELLLLMRDIKNKPALAEEIGGQLSGAIALLGCVATVGVAGFWTFL
jgi:hypothetical protein